MNTKLTDIFQVNLLFTIYYLLNILHDCKNYGQDGNVKNTKIYDNNNNTNITSMAPSKQTGNYVYCLILEFPDFSNLEEISLCKKKR